MAEKTSESDLESQDLDYEDPCVDSDQSEDDDPCNEPDSEPEESSDEGTEADRSRHHTVVFKCIGATKSNLIASGRSVPVWLNKEPHYPYNSRAIAFTYYVDGQWKRIGYVVVEIVDKVHNAIDRNQILSVTFSWVRYITEWSRSGPDFFFAEIAISKVGSWPYNVGFASSTK